MPRNSSGAYTLPAGNPVAPGTLIDSVWANDTLSDIAAALTDSLSRKGDGGMLADFSFSDGTVAAPGLAFTSQSNLGFYKDGTNILGIASAGGAVAKFSNTTVQLLKPTTAQGITATTITATGAVTAQAGLGVTGLLTANTGLTVTGQVGVTGDATLSGAINAANGNVTGVLTAGTLNAANSTISGGLNVATVTASGVVSAGTLNATTATVSGVLTSSSTFNASLINVGTLNVSGSIVAPGPLRINDGALAAPAYSFTSETTTGLYRPSASVLGVSVAGVERARFTGSGASIPDLTVAGTLTASGTLNVTGLFNANTLSVASLAASGGINTNTLTTNGNALFTSTVTVQKADPILTLNKLASGQQSVVTGSLNGAPRWAVLVGNSANETGSANTGSDFAINRYADAGTFLDAPFSISRSTGRTWMNEFAIGAQSKMGMNETSGQGVIWYTGTKSSWWAYNYTSDTLQYVVGGVEAMRFDSAGNVFFKGMPLVVAEQAGISAATGGGGTVSVNFATAMTNPAITACAISTPGNILDTTITAVSGSGFSVLVTDNSSNPKSGVVVHWIAREKTQ